MKLLLLSMAAFLASVPTLSHAQQFGRTTSADWVVVESDDGQRCGFTRDFEGPGATNLFISFKPDNTGFLAADNSGWSIREGETFRLFMRVGAIEREGQATGYRPSGRGGFTIGLPDASYLDILASGRSMELYRQAGEDWTLIYHFRLDGTREAVRLLRQCLRIVGARLARQEADRRRLEYIPADPFARPSPPTTPPPPPTRPFSDVVRGVGSSPPQPHPNEPLQPAPASPLPRE